MNKYTWFIEDCTCIDCECVRLGINPLPGKIMHDIWKKQEENYEKNKNIRRNTSYMGK